MSTRVLRYKKSTVYGGALVENSQRVPLWLRGLDYVYTSFEI
nr:MAG TPA: hypothetical protein [Caudoviricetes sp.]